MKRRWIIAVLVSVLATLISTNAALAYPHVYFQDAAKWAVKDGNAFSPAPGSEWYYQNIVDAANWEIVVGVPTGSATDRCPGCNVMVPAPRSFSPANSITRAEFAALLARLIGRDRESAPPAKFRDTPSTEWYQQYLGPLVQANVVRLTDYYLDTFRSNDPITRREMAVWTGRAATAYGIGATPADLTRFADGASEVDQDLARAVTLEIIKGKTRADGSVILDLDGKATRAEATTMLMRMVPRLNRNAPDTGVLAEVVKQGLAAYAKAAKEVLVQGNGYSNPFTYVALNRQHFKDALGPYFSDLSLEFIRDQRTSDTGFIGDIEPSSGWFKLAPSVLADLSMWGSGSNLTALNVTQVSAVRVLDRFAEVEVKLVYDDTKFTGDIERWTQTRRVYLAQQNSSWVMTATKYVGSTRELIRK